MSILVRRAGERSVEAVEGRTTRHSFSFGAHYDPDNVGFGRLVAHNDDLLAPAVGYDDHPHSNTEIVTWVISGTLVHTDSLGHRTQLTPGMVQVQSTGSGIVHSEVADRASGPTRFIQAWLRPDEWDLAPQRRSVQVDPADSRGEWQTVVGGRDGLAIAGRGVRFSLLRPATGWVGALPDAGRVHLFVASGRVRVGVGPAEIDLEPGDALRVTDEPQLPVLVLATAELLAWSL